MASTPHQPLDIHAPLFAPGDRATVTRHAQATAGE